MNNIKLLYFNSETLDRDTVIQTLKECTNYKSHQEVKLGLILINYDGKARDLFNALGSLVSEQSMLILDLDSGDDSYWGYMNQEIWVWLINNRR